MAGPPELRSRTARISADLARAGIRHAVSGAVAMTAHGVGRSTFDIDILVIAPSIRLPEVFGLIRRHGFAGDDRELLESLRDRYVAALEGGPIKVEVLVPVLPYHGTLVDRAVVREVEGVRVPFVSLEDLIVLKMLWRRPKDVADVHGLIAAAGAHLDAAYVRSTLASILPAEDPRHAEIADWILKFGGPGGA
ncbi:MAG: nucleotidyltransferase [Planctomycetota bacterium]